MLTVNRAMQATMDAYKIAQQILIDVGGVERNRQEVVLIMEVLNKTVNSTQPKGIEDMLKIAVKGKW